MLQPYQPDRNIALELIRVTEAAAIAAARWSGRGDKNAADGAAVDAMRFVLGGIAMDGIVVIGEGEKDDAPMLYNGERIGDGRPPLVDIAVDPVDGTTLTAMGRNGALAVIALSERGTMFNPGPCVYMNKIAVGPRGRGSVDINASATDNLTELSKRLKKPIPELGVVILDRPRHDTAPRQRSAKPGRASSRSPTATWPAPSRPAGRTPAPTFSSASAAPRKASSRRRR